MVQEDKPVPVANIRPVRFIGSPTSQGITGSIHVYWDPERSADMITKVVIPVEEALADIGMKI